jgi:curved DNA-binding protein CbpA
MSEPIQTTVMRCHYDVMEVDMTCTIDEIKKQYKKLALQWHPDRNHGQEELATKNFKDLSGAYAVLSDSQERKWYDDHREAILKGGDGTNNGDDDDDDSGDTINLWKYFNSTCYDGFGDDKDGFYEVYKGVFEDIERQELNHISNSNKGVSDTHSPSFGSSFSPASEFLRFYAYWENFVSKMSFSWEDKYNVLDAANRQVRRAMEKENLKFREVAKKEFVLQVRSLTAHVKRRDTRYSELEEQARQKKIEEEERKTALRTEEAFRRKEAREARLLTEQYTPEELAKRAEERKHAFLLADNDSEDDDDDAELDAAEFYTEAELYQRLQELKLEQAATGNTNDAKKKGKKGKKGKGFVQTTFKKAGADIVVSDESDTDDLPVTVFSVLQDGVTVENEDASLNRTGVEVEEDTFCCDICIKKFKTELHLTQHLASKVHRKKAQEVEKEVQKEVQRKAKIAAKMKVSVTTTDSELVTKTDL